MNFKEFLQQNTVILDGGMGTLLQARGLGAGEAPERWNLTHPDVIRDIHTEYFSAGSNVVSTNTFGANLLKFSPAELENIVGAAVQNARSAAKGCDNGKEKFVALDIGPTGKLLRPLGELEFEKAVEIFAATVKLGVKYGVDAILIETMNDSLETKAALLAAKENSALPVLVSNAYGDDGKLMTGSTPAAMVALAEGMGADAIGANCSLGPDQLTDVITELLEYASVPVLLKPNAGIPREENGKTVYDITPEQFADKVAQEVGRGVRLVGGCCGTTPEYIAELSRQSLVPQPLQKKQHTLVSSYTHAVKFGDVPLLIGERINPTGKKRFKQALLCNDTDYILSEGIKQQEKGVDILDVNVGLPDIDEVQMLGEAVYQLQSVLDLPLQIDTADPAAMESALRRYNGKAMINSVNGKQESMHSVFPLVKKYGGVVVALTLDEKGIPATAEGRIAIAENILRVAAEYGIEKKDIVFDTLAMTVSADQRAARTTLNALRHIKQNLGCHTSLGVSNVSFGLPCRDALNSVFFAMALENGLSAAIMNPFSEEMLKVFTTYKALNGQDDNCADYIAAARHFTLTAADTPAATQSEDFASPLQRAIIKGLRDSAADITSQMLTSVAGIKLVNEEIIPALNVVGKGFESKKMFLPQLLMSAEAAKSAFEVIKSNMSAEHTTSKGTVVLATVEGDVHDIGKNIVRLLLENYGFSVIDLGKDAKIDTVVDAVATHRARLLGLSALMTTTVPAMQETIRRVKEKVPACKIMVGGAVLTEDYARRIGADHYAPDALDGIRYAEQLFVH